MKSRFLLALILVAISLAGPLHAMAASARQWDVAADKKDPPRPKPKPGPRGDGDD